MASLLRNQGGFYCDYWLNTTTISPCDFVLGRQNAAAAFATKVNSQRSNLLLGYFRSFIFFGALWWSWWIRRPNKSRWYSVRLCFRYSFVFLFHIQHTCSASNTIVHHNNNTQIENENEYKMVGCEPPNPRWICDALIPSQRNSVNIVGNITARVVCCVVRYNYWWDIWRAAHSGLCYCIVFSHYFQQAWCFSEDITPMCSYGASN